MMSCFPLQNLPPSSERSPRLYDKDHLVGEYGSCVSDESSYGPVADNGAAQHSLVLLQSLKQSRHFYSTRLLPTFRSSTNPPNPTPTPHTLQDIGSASILIGPCQFNQCQLYQVQYVSNHPETDPGQISAHEDAQNAHPSTDALGDSPFNELGWLDLDQAVDLPELDAITAHSRVWTDVSATQNERSSGEAREQGSPKLGGTEEVVRLEGGTTDEENLHFTPDTNSSELNTPVLVSDTRYLEKQRSQDDKPTFTLELKKAIQLTATLELRLAELLHKTRLGGVREPELMELNGRMKAIEREVTSGKFDWRSMLAKTEKAQKVQRRDKEQIRENHEERRESSRYQTIFSHQHSDLSPSPIADLLFATPDDGLRPHWPTKATTMELPSAPMLWSRSSPKSSATPEARHNPNHQSSRLSSTPTRLITNSSPFKRPDPAGLVSEYLPRSLFSFDPFAPVNLLPGAYDPADSDSSRGDTLVFSSSNVQDHHIAHPVHDIGQLVGNEKSADASIHLDDQPVLVESSKSPSQHDLPLVDQAWMYSASYPSSSLQVNEVIISFPENPDELFLIPLSRSIISRDLVEEEGSIRISFFTPTPSTLLPPPTFHSRVSSSGLTLQDQAFNHSDLVRVRDTGYGDEERIEMMTIVIENYPSEVWAALEKSYVGHLNVIFEGMDGRKERVSEFQSMLHRGLPSSPPANSPTTTLNKSVSSIQFDGEYQEVALEQRDQEPKFYRDKAARVCFETHGQWPDGYEAPLIFEEIEEFQEDLENLEGSEVPIIDESAGITGTATLTAELAGGRRKEVVKKVDGRERERRMKMKMKRVASSEHDILSDNLQESNEDAPATLTHPRPKRKTKTPDYIIEPDREPTPLTPFASSDSDQGSSGLIVIKRVSSRVIPPKQPFKASTSDRRKHQPVIRVSSRSKASIPASSRVPSASRAPNRTKDASMRNLALTIGTGIRNRVDDRSDSDGSDLLIM